MNICSFFLKIYLSQLIFHLSARFNSKISKKQHIVKKKVGKKPFVCQVCTQGEAVSAGRRGVPAQCLLSTLEIPQFQKGKEKKREEQFLCTDKKKHVRILNRVGFTLLRSGSKFPKSMLLSSFFPEIINCLKRKYISNITNFDLQKTYIQRENMYIRIHQ